MCVRSGMSCEPRTALKNTSSARRKASAPSPSSPRPVRRARTASDGGSVSSRPVPVPVPEHVSPLSGHTGPESVESLQFGANRSTISLAMNMYQNLGTRAPNKPSAISGVASPAPGSSNSNSNSKQPVWRLRSMRMPSSAVMEALLAVYFDNLHWFICVFHEPTFMTEAHEILSASVWRQRDMPKVLVLLTVAALGLKCAFQNTSAEGQRLLKSISSEPQALLEQMLSEVRLHLLDLLDESCIETVQVTVLLGGFYIFHGSPGLAWSMIGMSVRASYALALHCAFDEEEEKKDPVAAQVRRRCWNHVIVSDTFASQIYGRPASLDPAFSDLLPLSQMDDTVIHGLPSSQINSRPTGGVVDGDSVNALTFHWLKEQLYQIIRETLSTFRLLRLHSPMTVEDLESLIDAVKGIDARLAQWKRSLPPLFDGSRLPTGDSSVSSTFTSSSFTQLLEQQQDPETPVHDSSARKLYFQAWLLQNTYDAAVILVHRPLLEYRLSADRRPANLTRPIVDAVNRSFDTAVKAALRISHTPVMQFEHEFCLAFVFIHLFTAGVILCIPPTSHPHSNTAQEAKAGVFRIIQAAKALRPHSQIARHAEQLLSDLLKLSLHREVDLAFQGERAHESGVTSRESLPPEVSEISSGQNGSHEAVAYHSTSYNEPNMPVPQTESIGVGEVPGQWSDAAYFMPTDNAYLQTLDLPLDDVFGAFGQAMFNLMPDDPLNNWGWGKGVM
ncbi:fungal specific transcription factor domain-containing protein [Sarocladium implicatum]|nr:fungal specific transcription factor domain-containing protein [Sarocladium implicatum]